MGNHNIRMLKLFLFHEQQFLLKKRQHEEIDNKLSHYSIKFN